MMYASVTVSGYADLEPKWHVPARPVLKDYVSAVCTSFGVTRAILSSGSRVRSIAYPRFAACLLLRERRNLSYTQIGRMLGGRDHSTVIHACERARELIQNDPMFADRYWRAAAL